MREIKFRAWDKQDKRMMYRTIFDRNWYLTPKNDEGGCHCLREITPDDRTVIELMQFTGLLDKNGKEISEGDICWYFFDATNCQQLQVYSSDFNSVVKYYSGKGCFVLERIGKKEYQLFERFKDKQDDDSPTKLEVIGNIYENSELLNHTKE